MASYYTPSGTPGTGSAGASAPMRGEFSAIAAGFAFLPQVTGGTAAGLTFPNGTDTLIGRATTDTLSNKSIDGGANTLTNIGNTSLVSSSITIGATVVSLGSSAATISGLTLTSPTINGATLSGTLAGSPTVSGTWGLGTPSAITLTNGIGLPVSTGLTGLGTGVATALGQTVTGSDGIVLATSPTLTTPNLGTPTALTLTSATGLPVSTGLTGAGTGVVTALGQNVTGSGGIVLATSPALTTPNLGTPSAITLTNATGLALSTGVSGTLAAANGGTGVNNGANTLTLGASCTLNGGGTLSVASGKTLTASNSITLIGTDSTSITFPSSSKTLMANDFSNASGTLSLTNGGTNADLSATGGTSKVLMQASAGAAVTVRQLATTDLSDVTAPTTWVPTDQSGASLTLTVNDAYYTTRGKGCFLVFSITYPVTANGSNAAIGSLPVAPKSTVGLDQIFMISVGTAFQEVAKLNNAGSNTFTMAGFNTTSTATKNSDLSTQTIIGAFEYMTA